MMFDSEKALSDFCKEVSNTGKVQDKFKGEQRHLDLVAKCVSVRNFFLSFAYSLLCSLLIINY